MKSELLELKRLFDVRFAARFESRAGVHRYEARGVLGAFLALRGASDSEFIGVFESVIAHTVQHFAEEEADMDAVHYPNNHEHKAEHKKALEEMSYFMDKARSGKLFFAKAYASDRLGDWFRTHLLNMDSDFARVLRASR